MFLVSARFIFGAASLFGNFFWENWNEQNPTGVTPQLSTKKIL